MGIRIRSIGRGLPGDNVPGRIVTNADFARDFEVRRAALVAEGFLLAPDTWGSLDPEALALEQRRWKQLEMDPNWILENTGIRERRFCADEVCTSDLAVAAIVDCCSNAGIAAQDVGGIDLATVSPDYLYTPPTVTQIALKLGIPPTEPSGSLRQMYGADTSLACTSFLTALRHCHDAIVVGHHPLGIAAGADKMTTTFDRNNRALSVLADGGAALLLENTEEPNEISFFGANSFTGGMDGSKAELIITPKGGSKNPFAVGDFATPWEADHYITMRGPYVKRAAERVVMELIPQALAKAKVRLEDIDFLALHQANLRINEPIEEKLRAMGFRGTVLHNIQRFGNTTCASLPLVLWEGWQTGQLKYGDLVHGVTFGGGFSWASVIFRWTVPNPS